MMWLACGLVGVGIAYQLAAGLAVRRFFAPVPTPHAPAAAVPGEAVSLLKPLYGDEPRLAENLASFLAQDNAGPVQVVCGVNTPGDAAVAAVEALCAAHPNADIALSTGPVAPAANGKIANLCAMMPAAKHDILVLSDSDMVVGADYCARITAALAQPGVGAVSCLYVGRGDAGFWSQLGAAMISFQATPNVVFAVVHGLARPCMGSTIALRRETLNAIGGFAPLADVLADDYALGEAVTGLGLKVAIPPMLLVHAGTEASLRGLWRHFLRWAVTIRDLNRAGHYGSVVTQPLPLALLVGLFSPAGWSLALAALGVRLYVARKMRRASGQKCAPLWMVPLGDCLGFVVFLASLTARRIDWRGEKLTMTTKGRIAAPKVTGTMENT